MKLITSLLGVLALTFVTSAVAQEESPSPSPEQSTSTSTTAPEAPAPAPSAAPETRATATPTEQPGAQKKEKPTAAKPAAAPSGRKMSVEAALKDNENRWEAAVAKHDTVIIGSMAADDFAGVNFDGKVTSRSGLIAESKKDRETYKSAVNEKLAVHSYGPNVAVVVGTAHEKGTGKDGQPFDRKFRFTDTWVERNGRWQCVASQIMKVP
ncbi:MAG: nuclear transport factor 2 family protein [Chthoniobacterales bacterium]